MADTKRKIEVNPDEWDADIVDCPLADQDCYCGLLTVGTMQCVFSGEPVITAAHRFSCPLSAGPVEVSLKTKQAKTFYIQNPQCTYGGLMHFWKTGDCGYEPGISKARLFTLDEINAKHSIQSGEKLAWPKEYIDARAVDGRIDASKCDIEIAKDIAMAAIYEVPAT